MSKKIEIAREQLSSEDVSVLLNIRKLDDNPFESISTGNVEVSEKELTKIEKDRIKRDSVKTNLSKDDQNYLKRVCNDPGQTKESKIKTLLDHFKIKDVLLYKWVEELGLSLSPSQYSKAMFHTLAKKKRYLISSAQNASPVNKDLLHNMEAYAKHIDAEIGIIATRYKNPTSIWREEGDVWDKLTHPYLTAQRQQLHPKLLLLADLKIQATSPNPTNGIELFGGNSSVIVGAPRIEMRSVPVLQNQTQKFLHSTGTVTLPSFTNTVAGGKAAEHHSYGFIIVEIENDEIVHIRNVSAHEDGSFNDLIFRVDEQKIFTEETETLVWGDSHFAQKDEKVTDAFRKLCSDLNVTKSVLHDVWDSCSVNVHNLKDPVTQMQLRQDGKASLKKEFKQLKKELSWFEENMNETLVVASNHDDMLDRAIKVTSWRDHPYNEETFLKCENLVVRKKARNGVIPYTINKRFKKVKALGLDDSHIDNGVELALHGHKGPNGSRGNVNSFAKLSNKTIIGHSHSPSIKWGCYQVGVSCALQHGYNKGLSGWAYASCTLNKHGKRQMVVLHKETLSYTTLY